MTTACLTQTRPRLWRLTSIAGILGVLGIIFGIALVVSYTVPEMGLAMLWSVAVFGVIGGIVLIPGLSPAFSLTDLF